MLIRFRHTALHLVFWSRRERGDALRQDARIFGHHVELTTKPSAFVGGQSLKDTIRPDECLELVELFIQLFLFVYDPLLMWLHSVSPWWASKVPVHSPTNRALAGLVCRFQHLVGLNVCVP
jgi:hypothetical protein